MIVIRPATSADFDAIWPMLRAVFRAGDTYAVNPAITKAQARRYWMIDPMAVLVAMQDEIVVGTYYLRANQQGGGDHICNCGYIVAPAARGRGLARAMCIHSQTEARKAGFVAMQFNFVLTSNAGAVRLWRDLGFAVIGQIPDAFRHPDLGMVDALIMHKRLD